MDLTLKIKLYDKFREKFNAEDSEDLVEIVAAGLEAGKKIETDKSFSQREAQIKKMDRQTKQLKALMVIIYIIVYAFLFFK